ncbi:MAG TPA: aldo/keto reductase [Aggregatilinea sp.]|uniref:aldo/keto reductase n=1 Tax=Aggregatilinea sp. TaxID=2806333 RepID=UPI002D084B8B|nr:aldo/keto reductase [Aggregatilinea sp.]HML20556.1 aldo/keto reductase [Aggregatilinea sp.]
MNYRQLGKSDLAVTPIVMGCWGISDEAMWGPQDDADTRATIHAALDHGITFFDTAEAYGKGRSESILGEALKPYRDRVIIATKVRSANVSAPEIRAACDASLKRLQTDTIDVYQIHWPSHSVPFEETMGELMRLRDEGKIRYVGLSNHGSQDMAAMLALGPVISNQVPYNLLWRAIEDAVLPACGQYGLGVLAYSPLLHGLLTGKYTSAEQVTGGRARTRHFASHRPGARHGEPGAEDELFATIERIRGIAADCGLSMPLLATAWVLHQPGITAVIAGARTSVHLADAVRATEITLSADVLAALDAATLPLKQRMGPNPDLWQSDSRFR